MTKQRRSPKKITVIYNSVDEASPIIPPDQKVADLDTIEMAKGVADNLASTFQTELREIPFDHPEAASAINTDIVFNLCEGVGYDYGCKVIDSLESARIPYVGANSLNYHIGSDKALLKEVLNRYHLPTPLGQFFNSTQEKLNPNLQFPLLIKPELEHGSVGITQESVVNNEEQLREQISKIRREYGQGALVEEYVDGLELQLTFVGNGSALKMLPIKEILFVNGMSERWHIVTFAAKWEESSEEYKGTPTICPTDSINNIEKRALEKLGREIFLRTSCQDYTRIDIRYDKINQKPYILDVNPNPDLSSDAAVAKAAEAAGWNYPTLLVNLVMSAWKRITQPSKTTTAERYLPISAP
ncbi:MAG: ATP-grasp domain-containing protein [Deltaproteobacteria bacterium]|nr:ATP-grasp domain-containing protein [Deltaproteobacteria bacterium]